MSRTVRNILIVGAPRSGTSLTAGAFARHGYFIGRIEEEHMREGDAGNPFGYFEADDVIDANVELFEAAGFPHHNTWLFDEIGEDAIRRIDELEPRGEHRKLMALYDTHAPWVWKDPRLCFTLGYWWKIVDPARTGVVLVRRDFDQIYTSFRRRGWCREGEAVRAALEERIERHLQAAQETIQRLDIPHIAVEYAECTEDPEAVSRHLTEFTGTTFDPANLNVRPELNHSTGRGRLAARLRMSLDAGWLRHAKFLKPLVPRRLLNAILPEKRFEKNQPV
jgi:hypothetical protein